MILQTIRGIARAVHETYKRTAKFDEVFGVAGGSALDAALLLHQRWTSSCDTLRALIDEQVQRAIKDKDLAKWVAQQYAYLVTTEREQRARATAAEAVVGELRKELQQRSADYAKLNAASEAMRNCIDCMRPIIDELRDNARNGNARIGPTMSAATAAVLTQRLIDAFVIHAPPPE